MHTALTVFIGAGLLAGLLLTAWSWRQHRQWLRSRRQTGLHWSVHLLRLIMHMQQHRGMATAWLNGDTSFGARLQEKRQQIDALLLQLPGLPGEFNRQREDFERDDLQRLQRQWQVLSTQLGQLSAFESMTRHTALIGTLLAWLRALGDSCLHARSETTGLEVDSMVRAFVERLPVLAETLGQTRALGSGLLAAGGATAVGRVQMGYLCQRIESLLQASADAVRGPHTEHSLQQGFATVESEVQRLLGSIHAHILASAPAPLAASDYFRQASAAIDAVFALIESLQQRLQADPAQTL